RRLASGPRLHAVPGRPPRRARSGSSAHVIAARKLAGIALLLDLSLALASHRHRGPLRRPRKRCGAPQHGGAVDRAFGGELSLYRTAAPDQAGMAFAATDHRRLVASAGRRRRRLRRPGYLWPAAPRGASVFGLP